MSYQPRSRLWRSAKQIADILMANRDSVDQALMAFEAQIAEVRASLQAGDESAILETLTRARDSRERWLKQQRNNL